MTPRIVVTDVHALAGFLRSVFGAIGDVAPGRPLELRIGDSLVMLTESSDAREPLPAFLYVYVDDADACYERAVTAGAVAGRPAPLAGGRRCR